MPARLHIDLGKDEKGASRLAALNQLAASENHYWADEPSIGRLICALADSQLYYAVASDNLNDPNSFTHIIFLTQPGRKNMSGDPCIEGWLGTTNDIDKRALGLHTPASARALLRQHGVKIPQTVPVRHNVPYRAGGSSEAETLNKRDAYPWPGPWVGIPDSEIRWCQCPLRALETKILDRSDGEWTHYQILLTADEKPDQPSILRSRAWYIADNHWSDKTEASRYALAILDKIFDAARLSIHTNPYSI